MMMRCSYDYTKFEGSCSTKFDSFKSGIIFKELEEEKLIRVNPTTTLSLVFPFVFSSVLLSYGLQISSYGFIIAALFIYITLLTAIIEVAHGKDK
jgi:hypothetical protein